MRCDNCGATFKNDISYCMRCGTDLETGVTVEANIEPTKSITINKETLVKSYIGKKYSKFAYRNFSFCYMLFGPLYGFSRKMYLYSILNIIFFYGIYLLKNRFNGYLLLAMTILILIIFSYCFNTYYLRTVRKRVDRLVLKKSNLDMVMLQSICRKSGGLNWFFTSINIVLGVVAFVLITIFVLDKYDVISFLEESNLFEFYNFIKSKLIECFKLN